MRVGKLLNGFEVRVAGEGPEALVAEVWRVAPVAPDDPVSSLQLAHLAASSRPPEPTQPGTPPYWRADVFFHNRAATELRNPELTRAITDWLLSDTPAATPLLVQFHESAGTHWDLRRGVLPAG